MVRERKKIRNKKAILNIIGRYLEQINNEIDFIERGVACEGSGERGLYCYNCNLDRNCPYQDC